MKRCPKCEWEKPVHEFSQNRKMPDGRQTYCKPCTAKYAKRYNGAYRKQRLQADPDRHEAIKAAQRAHYRANKDRWWRTQLMKKYGVTLEWYLEQFARQGGRCAICFDHQDDLPRRLEVDHHHESGKVRELLCGLCNRGFGSFKEDVVRLRAALAYAERHHREPVLW